MPLHSSDDKKRLEEVIRVLGQGEIKTSGNGRMRVGNIHSKGKTYSVYALQRHRYYVYETGLKDQIPKNFDSLSALVAFFTADKSPEPQKLHPDDVLRKAMRRALELHKERTNESQK